MAVHRKTLTNRAVSALAVERDTVYWDRDLPGFGIRVYPGGGKVYIAPAREPDKTTKRVTVGRHDVLNADQARQRAAFIITRIRAGEDSVPLPLAARLNGDPTVADLAERYLEQHAAVRLKPRTRLRVRGMLDNHILPALGRMPQEAVEGGHVAAFHQALSGRPVTANKAVKLLSHMYRLGEGGVAEACEQVVEVVAQAGDGLGVGGLPGVCEASCGAERLGPVGGVHDGVEVVLDGVAVGLAHLVEDVPDLVRPAALQRDAGVDDRQGCDQALAAVGADHLETLSAEASAPEIGEEALPFDGTLAGSQAEVDDLLLAVVPDAERHQHRAPERAGPGPAGQHHAVEHQRLVDVLQRPAVEGRHRRIQGLGDAADGRGRDRAAQQRQQNLAHLAGTETQHEAGQMTRSISGARLA